MALLKMKLDNETYDIDPDTLTLGEAHILEREYGMTDFTEFNFFSPAQMTGLFFIAVQRAHPELNEDGVREKIEGLAILPIIENMRKQVEKDVREAERKRRPPVAGASGAPAGGQATTPGPRGRRKSATSSA